MGWSDPDLLCTKTILSGHALTVHGLCLDLPPPT